MKRSSVLFLQLVIVLIALGTLFLLLWGTSDRGRERTCHEL